MGRPCMVCGGLVVASNEVLGYSGPICNGLHGASYITPSPHLEIRLLELEKRLQELTQRLNQTVSDNGLARTLQDHPSKTNDGGRDGG